MTPAKEATAVQFTFPAAVKFVSAIVCTVITTLSLAVCFGLFTTYMSVQTQGAKLDAVVKSIDSLSAEVTELRKFNTDMQIKIGRGIPSTETGPK